ncbi:MAG: relaxase [Verrucomicrobiae bacterium]|nr:relaxase [Verrucomicrobiae bacterium]
MATTSIWPINGSISHVIQYVGNLDKTTQIKFSDPDLQSLKYVMDYAVQPTKTEQQQFVSGVNCLPEIARQQMLLTKQHFGKLDGRTAYHAYQSFKPEEATPEIAHLIGVEFAEKLWGDRFQVVVATHVDKAHIHNHFVINSVSFLDGKKFHSDCKSYFGQMRVLSDELCKQHGLSVIEEPLENVGRSRSHPEWQADKENQPTWRKLIRDDIDVLFDASRTWSQLIAGLKEKGYEVKLNVKHLAVKPPGKERFIRLRSLGVGYSEDELKERILQHHLIPNLGYITEVERTDKAPIPIPTSFNRYQVFRHRHSDNFRYSIRKRKGPLPLYIRYLNQMGALRPRSSPTRRTHFLLREDIRHLDRILDEFKLIRSKRFDRYQDLVDYRAVIQEQIDHLLAERKNLHLQKLAANDPATQADLRQQAKMISQQLRHCRKELRLCDGIQTRSIEMATKLDQIKKKATKTPMKDKEDVEYDQRR